jgi:putative flippase GtrA
MMINWGRNYLKKHREIIAYIFVGGTTVAVNVVVYLLMLFVLSDIPANTIAFFVAVMYAYFTNCLLVFRRRLSWASFFQFWGMRIGTLLLDNGGMWLLLTAETNRLLAKILVNVILIILNYLFSKYIIFNKHAHNNQS